MRESERKKLRKKISLWRKEEKKNLQGGGKSDLNDNYTHE